jgi:tetratricopeptide (TPR) repeat protein
VKPAWIVGLLAAATLAVYAQTLGFGFVSYDDPRYVQQEPLVCGGPLLSRLRYAATANVVGNWQPITVLSHMIDCELFGLHPGGHHLTSVLLHLANTLLVFQLFARLTGARGRSALLAAFFAVHPLHVESVAWVAERKDVLSACLGLLALRAYADYARRPSALRHALVALWLALGLAAKPMLVTLPLVFLLLDHWPLGRARRALLPRLLLEKLPWLALSLAASAMTLLAQAEHGALAPGDALPLRLCLAHAAASYLWYVGKLLWPEGLGILYPHPYLEGGTPWAAWQVAASAAALVAISAAALRRPYATVGWLWFLGMLVPVIGLVPAGFQGMADRYTYLPSIGLGICLVWGGAELASRLRPAARRALEGAALLALVALAAAAFAQARHWRDSQALYQRALEVSDGRSRVHANLGAVLRAEGRVAEAIAHYRSGLGLYPDDAVLRTNLGNALLDQHRVDEAIAQYREALRRQPDYAMAHANLAVALMARGDRAGAEAAARESVRLGPELAPAWQMLADLLFSAGKAGEAAAAYREALRLRPDSAEARAGLASAEAALAAGARQ